MTTTSKLTSHHSMDNQVLKNFLISYQMLNDSLKRWTFRIKEVKVVAHKLKGTVAIQWDNLQSSHVLQGKRNVKTWHRMHHLLDLLTMYKRYFVSTITVVNESKQSKNMPLISKAYGTNNLCEIKAHIIGRFLDGLQTKKDELQPVHTLQNAIRLAKKMEMQLEK